MRVDDASHFALSRRNYHKIFPRSLYCQLPIAHLEIAEQLPCQTQLVPNDLVTSIEH